MGGAVARDVEAIVAEAATETRDLTAAAGTAERSFLHLGKQSGHLKEKKSINQNIKPKDFFYYYFKTVKVRLEIHKAQKI